MIRRLYYKILGVVLYFCYKLKPNVRLGKSVVIKGCPLIDIHDTCALEIGDHVTLNSKNHGYHLSMFAPVKLMADRAGAEITIGDNTRIHGSCIHAYERIVIGKRCLIAANCQIFDGNGHDLSFPGVENRIKTVGGSKPVMIEDDVWLGSGVTVLPGVTIGRGSVVSAGSVVTKSIPAMCVAGGNPATVIKQF